MLQTGAKNGRKFPLSLWFWNRQFIPWKGWKKWERQDKEEFEESDMISKIFDDENLGNTAYEPGSHLIIMDALATWITTNL